MDVLCPLDDTPCTKDCPDRYKDRAEGGCLLTTSLARRLPCSDRQPERAVIPSVPGWKAGAAAVMYWTCPYCGANLDPGERCDCRDPPRRGLSPPPPPPGGLPAVTGNIFARKGTQHGKQEHGTAGR